jgi:two-component system, OmpR family, response regulator
MRILVAAGKNGAEADCALTAERLDLLMLDMSGGATLLRHGALAYDQVGRVASLNGAPLALSGRELNLLEILLTRPAIEVYVHRCARSSSPVTCASSPVRGLGYSLEKTARV